LNEIETRLRQLGLDIPDIDVLVTQYANTDPDCFMQGLEKISLAVYLDQVPGPPEPATEPWKTLYAGMVVGGTQIGFDQAFASFEPKVQMAIADAISRAAAQVTPRPGVQQKRVLVSSPLLEGPDKTFPGEIEDILTDRKLSIMARRKTIEAMLVDWLSDHGHFVRSPSSELYYLYKDKHKLFEFETLEWHAFLHVLTGINPSGNDFSMLAQTCRTAAQLHGSLIPVVRFSHYDLDTGILRISRFNGETYVLDGTDIKIENNGDGPILFSDNRLWRPYAPDFDNANDATLAAPFRIPEWAESIWEWAAIVWGLSLFFTELCPTRPIAIFLGEKGSGKSMTLRILLRLLFGSLAQINSTPDKPDAFMVMAHYNHLLALDNFDNYQDWMRDKLASLATGMEDQVRTLYTTKEMTTITYRCWLAVTARTPETLRRDDLADRLLIFPLERIPDDRRRREGIFLTEVDQMRNAWWGSILAALNKVVAALNMGALPDASTLRLADWETLGRVISHVYDKDAEWTTLIEKIKASQATFLVEGSVALEAINKWLENPVNLHRAVKARLLFEECQQELFGYKTPDQDWPKSSLSFAKRIANISEYLKMHYKMKTWHDRQGNWYIFDVKP
jgi:hypothetical protein